MNTSIKVIDDVVSVAYQDNIEEIFSSFYWKFLDGVTHKDSENDPNTGFTNTIYHSRAEIRKPETVDFLIPLLYEAINKYDKGQSTFDRAVAFYIVNKCSFSGLTESSSFSKQASISNFSMRGIEKLPEYSSLISHWHINGYSYEHLMTTDMLDGIFMYLDPPYDIKDNLYGKKGSMHSGFDHDKFAADCDKYDIPMLISYNSDQLVKDRFKNWNAAEFDLTYTMRSVGEYMRDQKQRKELLLFNYGTKGLA